MDIDLIKHILIRNQDQIIGYGLLNKHAFQTVREDAHWSAATESNILSIDMKSTVHVSETYRRSILTRLSVRANHDDLLPVWQTLEQIETVNQGINHYDQTIDTGHFWRLSVDVVEDGATEPRVKPFAFAQNREYLKFIAESCTKEPYNESCRINWDNMDCDDGTLYGYAARIKMNNLGGILYGWSISPPSRP